MDRLLFVPANSPGSPQRNSNEKEKVFKTPMTFRPRLIAEQTRFSPRLQHFKAQLGLDEDEDKDDASSSEGDSGQNDPNDCLRLEWRVLQRELEERNEQRDNLLLKIRTLTDSNKSYKSKMEKQINSNQQRFMIMCKTHELHLHEKNLLVQNLQDIVDEQETRVVQLEAQLRGDKSIIMNCSEKTSSTARLVSQVQRLQSQNAELNLKVLQLEKQVEVNGQEEQQPDVLTIKQPSKVDQELERLRTKMEDGGTDAEKLQQKVELENNRLQTELREIRLQNTRVQNDIESRDLMNQRLKEENEKLKQKVQSLETELGTKKEQAEETEDQLQAKLKSLTAENMTLSLEVRELGVKLSFLQAKSPEVVTKIRRVEVESESHKVALDKSQQELNQVREENETLQERVQDLLNTCQSTEQQLAASQSQVLELHNAQTEKNELQAQLAELRAEHEQTTCYYHMSQKRITELEARLLRYELEIDSLQRKTQEQMERIVLQKEEEVKHIRFQTEEKVKDLTYSLSTIRAQFAVVWPRLQELIRDYYSLRDQCQNLPRIIQQQVAVTTKQICKALADVNHYNQDLVRKYRKEMQLRKKYHNELVELKGNIRVFCRVRPAIKEDGTGPMSKTVVTYDPDDDCQLGVLYKGRTQNFEADQLFTPEASQEKVFSEVQALVTSCIDGFNVCIFAYGQTGSGKTYTMEGTRGNPGINQRALQQLFDETASRSREYRYSISVSVIEIYNEQIKDLLNCESTDKLEVKMLPEGGLYVPGLATVEVKSADDVNQVFSVGQENRATAFTNMNEHSSRSHALLCITVVGKNLTTGNKTIGKLNLVDLAGSERVSKSGADGTRLKEAQSINKSLSCLGDVIHALRNKVGHVPYRNSKLTYLLQDCLGGDSKTLMIVQIAPVEKNVGETVASLNFAQRVRSVELGQASKKTESAELVELKEKLAQYEEHGHLLTNHYSRATAKTTTPSKLTSSKSTFKK